MNDVQLFCFESNKVRTLIINGEPWFVGKDIADILGYQNGSRDINRHVDEDDRVKTMVFDGNQNKETIVINESGVYGLIFSSKLPDAKSFKRWVTTEVLPQIRVSGSYQKKELTGEELMAKKQNLLVRVDIRLVRIVSLLGCVQMVICVLGVQITTCQHRDQEK